MSSTILLCTLGALLPQATPPVDGPDLSLLQPIHAADLAERPRGPRPPFVTHYRSGELELVFVAAKHEQEIDSPTHQLVRSVIENYKPAFVIAEGWPSSVGVSPPRMIQQMSRRLERGEMGESPYAALLAHQQGVDFIGGEPDLEDQCDALREQGFRPTDILAFVALRQAINQGERGNADSIPASAERTMKRFADALGVPPPSWADIESWHEKTLGRPLEIDRLRKPLIAPRISEQMTVLNKIGIAVEIIRETNIINLEAEMLAKHKRILVVYGSGHLNYERPVLADWLGEPLFSSRSWPADKTESTPRPDSSPEEQPSPLP